MKYWLVLLLLQHLLNVPLLPTYLNISSYVPLRNAMKTKKIELTRVYLKFLNNFNTLLILNNSVELQWWGEYLLR